MNDISTKQAVDRLCKALKEDPGYYYSWQANIAMAFYDEHFFQKGKTSQKKIHEIANSAAKCFLNNLIRSTS